MRRAFSGLCAIALMYAGFHILAHQFLFAEAWHVLGVILGGFLLVAGFGWLHDVTKDRWLSSK